MTKRTSTKIAKRGKGENEDGEAAECIYEDDEVDADEGSDTRGK